jgi:alpha-tubulin suppressor-like RCC1 family protein
MLSASVAAGSSAGTPALLLSFGEASRGALGRGAYDDGDAGSTPTRVVLGPDAGEPAEVAVGAEHALAVTTTGGVLTFGVNQWGQLGSRRNLGSSRPNPQPQRIVLPDETTGARAAAAGNAFSLVLTDDGRVYSFGEDSSGQLGRAAPRRQYVFPVPQPLPLPVSAGPAVQVAAGYAYSLVLTTSGQVFSFGENKWGQLGQARNAGTERANPEPAPISMPPGAGPVTQIAAGGWHALLLTRNGQLYGVGDDRAGQIGPAADVESENPEAMPVAIALPEQRGAIVQIAAGGGASFVLTASGQLYSFGAGAEGELGRPGAGTGEQQPDPTPTQVTLPLGAAPPTSLSVGDGFALVQTADGQVYEFGSDHSGELGVLENVDEGESYPTPFLLSIPGFTGLVPISGGSTASGTFVRATAGAPTGAPKLSGLKVTPRAHELTTRGRRCYTPYATSRRYRCARTTPLVVNYTITAPAAISLTVEREATSIVWHNVCLQAGAARHPGCRFEELMGTIDAPGAHNGTSKVRFDGILNNAALTPGRYRLTAVAENGPLVGVPEHATFEVQP